MFTLVIPFIEGDIETKYDTKTAIEAADAFWKNFSDLIVNHLHEYYFTLKETDNDDKFYHFKVTESKMDNGDVKYVIVEVDINLTPKEIYALNEKLEQLRKQTSDPQDSDQSDEPKDAQTGGRNHYLFDDDDSSSSSSSSSSLFDDEEKSIDKVVRRFNKLRYHNRPITHYYYNPILYKLTSTVVPIFTYPIAPKITIDLASVLFD